MVKKPQELGSTPDPDEDYEVHDTPDVHVDPPDFKNVVRLDSLGRRRSPKQDTGQAIVLDIATVRKIAVLQPTIEEAAAFFDLAARTMKRKLRQPGFKEAWAAGRFDGRMSLRRMMFIHAQRPNSSGVAAAIHLSKHWLGEVETVHMKGGGASGQAIIVKVDKADLKL